jgi:hypothetical protein
MTDGDIRFDDHERVSITAAGASFPFFEVEHNNEDRSLPLILKEKTLPENCRTCLKPTMIPEELKPRIDIKPIVIEPRFGQHRGSHRIEWTFHEGEDEDSSAFNVGGYIEDPLSVIPDDAEKRAVREQIADLTKRHNLNWLRRGDNVRSLSSDPGVLIIVRSWDGGQWDEFLYPRR